MKRMVLLWVLAGTLLTIGLVGAAKAQTGATPSGDRASEDMTQHDAMGGMMMQMMMGDDPVGACASMMQQVARDPELHKRLNAVMRQQMEKQRTNGMHVPSRPTPSSSASPWRP